MGGIDRSAAAKIFQEALTQFQDNLQDPLPETDPIVEEASSNPSKPETTKPGKVKPLSAREAQLAVIAEAIADLEEFLNSNQKQTLPTPSAPEETS